MRPRTPCTCAAGQPPCAACQAWAQVEAPPATHCPWGHRWTPETTYVTKRGSRQCKVCQGRLHRQWRQQTQAGRVPPGCALGVALTALLFAVMTGLLWWLVGG